MKLFFALLISVISLEASDLQFPTHGLTLTLPDGIKWSTDKEFDNPEPSVSVRVYSAKEGGRQVQLMFGDNGTPTKDLEGFARGWIRGMAKSGVVIISEKKGTIDGVAALFCDVEVRSTATSRRALAVVTLQGSKCYAFTFSSELSEPSADPILRAIIASVKIRK